MGGAIQVHSLPVPGLESRSSRSALASMTGRMMTHELEHSILFNSQRNVEIARMSRQVVRHDADTEGQSLLMFHFWT